MTHAVVNGHHRCFEPLDALCRQIWDCSCEWFWNTEKQPDGTWTHGSDDPDLACRSHHQEPGKDWCNIVEWINTQGPTECWLTGGDYYGLWNYDIDLPDGPIRYEWGDEWLDWDYIGMTPAMGRFIARWVVAAWAEAVGLD